LEELAQSLGLVTDTRSNVATALAIPDDIQVLFLLSVPGLIKEVLLRKASLLVYTPTNEHFGIVPVEAMQHGVPVLAANTGGPLETIVEGKTGWLRDVSISEEWTAVMRKVLYELDDTSLKVVGHNGRERVKQHFTRATMAKRFQHEIEDMAREKRPKFLEGRDIVLALGIAGAFTAAFVAVILRTAFSARIDSRASAFAHAARTTPSNDGRQDFVSMKII